MAFREEDELVIPDILAIVGSRLESESREDLVVVIMIALLRKIWLCASSHSVL
jgi:hypothetical protein